MFWTSKSAVLVCVCAVVGGQVIPGKARTNDGEYNDVNTDGSFDFGYSNKDRGQSYHLAHANANGVVGGRFGARDPATDTVKETIYTAGPRGFRAKGPNVHRIMDLDQRPRGPIGNKDDPNFDPNEDPSYAFKIDTRTYTRNENADSRGDVKGHYSFVDDVGERHDISYIAGRDTGFHVSSAHPDGPNVIGSPFHRAPLVRGETRPRGRTAVQRGLDGSYRFISAGPDQRRTESSDSHGNVRGSYTFLDDKGVQRTVHYIAGPGIGYRIVKNGKDPYIPPYFPTIPSAYDPDFIAAGASSNFSPDDSSTDDVFKGPDGTAASGHVKPPPFPINDKERPSNKPSSSESTGSGSGPDNFSGSGSENFSGSDNFGGSDTYGGSDKYGGSSESDKYGGSSESDKYGGPSGSDKYGGPSGSDKYGGASGSDKYGGPSSSDKYGRPGGSDKYGGSSGSDKFGGPGGSDKYGGPGGSDKYGGPSGSDKYGGPNSGTSSSFSSSEPFRPSGSTGGGSSGSSGSSSVSGPGGDSNESGYQGPSFEPGPISEGGGFVDEEIPSFGGASKPTKGPGKPGRPTSKPYRPTKKPYVPLKPFDSNKDDNAGFDDGKGSNGPQFAIGFNIHHNKPGTTIIRNIGRDYFGVPPGVSVRAHVQSIDLYPFDSQPISPSEAIEKDKT